MRIDVNVDRHSGEVTVVLVEERGAFLRFNLDHDTAYRLSAIIRSRADIASRIAGVQAEAPAEAKFVHAREVKQ